jgi:hypothetical protein
MPTLNHLFIGLGGTGGKVLRELRKRIYEEFGSNDPSNGLYVDYLYVDSSDDDLNSREGWKVLGKSVHLQTNQKLSIHGISLSMLDNLGMYPGVKAILTEDDVRLFKEKLGPLVTQGIGGQRRRLGRTLLANNLAIQNATNAGNFNVRLQSKVAELAGTSHSQAMDFHICAGLAGGTGSGTIIDVISQIRKEYSGGNYRIYLYLYVPEMNVVNPAHDQDGFYQSNGYAALLELNALSTGNYYPVDITGETDPNTGKVRRLQADTPFDAAYLYSNVNTGGQQLELSKELPSAVADFIYQKSIAPGLSVNSEMGRLVGCENDGAGPEYDMSGHATRSRKFISFGIKRIEYPETEIGDFVTLKYAEQATRQLEYNFWQDGVGFGERSLEEVGLGFWDDIKTIRNREALLLSNGHLTLSRPIIQTPNTKGWKDIDNTWETRTQGFMDDVQTEQEKKSWLPEFSKLCEDYFDKHYRVHGVKKFYEIQGGEKRGYAAFIRRHIETGLFDEWNAGTKSVLEIEKYTRLLMKDLEERAVAFDRQKGALAEELDGINAAIKQDTLEWSTINWLLDSISGKSRKILSQYKDHLRDYYINLTRQEGYAYAVQLIGEIGIQLSAMLNGILAFKSSLVTVLDIVQKQAAGKCTDTGNDMIAKMYNPDVVRSFTKSATTNADYQRANANTIRHRMVDQLGAGDDVVRSFARLSDSMNVDATADLVYEVCRSNALDAMEEASKTDPTLKMVGVNILDKLAEEYNTDAKLETLVKGWVNNAKTYLQLNAEEQAKTFGNAGGSMMSLIQVSIPQKEGDAFREKLINAIQGEFPGFNRNTDLSVNPKSNQIVIVAASAGFPLRYVANVKTLRAKYDYKLARDGELARMSLHGESFQEPLPSLYELSPAEIRRMITRPVLLGYALGMFSEQTNPETGEHFDAIGIPNQFGRLKFEKVGKDILNALDYLSQDFALARKVKGKVEEKIAADCRSNEQKRQVAMALGDVLEQRILPLCGNNTFSEAYRTYEAIAEAILSNELKQL